MPAAVSVWPRSAGLGRSGPKIVVFRGFMMSLAWGTMLTCLWGPALVFGGKALCGYVWVVQGLFAALALVVCRRGRITFPVLAWVPWLIWITIRCDFADFSTVQRTFMLWAAPIVGITASAVIVRREDLEWLIRSFYVLVPAFALLYLACALGWLPPGVIVGNSASLMVLCLAGSYCAPYVYKGRWRQILMWLCCVAVCAVDLGRMATATCILTVPLSPARTGVTRRVLLACVTGLAALLAFSLPRMQEKMSTGGGTNTIQIVGTGVDVYDSGRSDVWEAFWEEAWKSKTTPFFGAGGNASEYFCAEIAPGWEHPHSDYIRVFFDYGLVGLLLLAAPMGYTLIYTYRATRAASDRLLRDAWTVSCGGLISTCLLAITDNVILYVAFFGCLLFGILGGAHGVAAAQEQLTRGEHAGYRR